MTYPLSAAVIAAYESTSGRSYSQIADVLNKQRVPAPPRSPQWTIWNTRNLCRVIGKTSQHGPKVDSARTQTNRTLAKLIDAIPACGSVITAQRLSEVSGVSLSTCYKYTPLVSEIAAGRIDPGKFPDTYELWRYWQAKDTDDAEAAPV